LEFMPSPAGATGGTAFGHNAEQMKREA
jgi:hypothetical protein